ncbi:MAG: DUF1761 domain-containing protein [Bacteroidia bacterium]
MENWIAVAVAPLLALVVGFVWYHEKVFGTAWMKTTGMTREKAEQGNMPLIIWDHPYFRLYTIDGVICFYYNWRNPC